MAKRRANGEGSLRKRKDGRWEGWYTAGTDPVTGKAICAEYQLGKIYCFGQGVPQKFH